MAAPAEQVAALNISEEQKADPVAEKLPYYHQRVNLFEKYHERQQKLAEEARARAEPITVTLPDGTKKEAIKGATTPLEIAQGISAGLAKKAVVAVVDGGCWDLFRPLEKDCDIKICTFDDPEGKDTWWHSSAHVLGQALELEFGVDLTIGPSIEEGFYYDCYMGDRSLKDDDKKRIEKRMEGAVKEKQQFQRVVVTRDEALAMFQENKFKIEIISGLPEDATISLYRNGPMVDLCSGPHVPNTAMLRSVAVNSMSRAFWRGDVKKDGLQRVYGITFPDNKQMKEYKHRIEEAKKRDHRVLGQKYELFFFNPLSPGSCFFTPEGTRVYNALIEYLREKYWDYSYQEVITPNIYNFDLWKTSGHADHYKDNMFSFHVEEQEYGLKPMNCPGHCVMFGNRTRSYRELPLRMADFGVLHRNEFSGALHGLTRVRRFQQDDAHIFCRPDQVMDEVLAYVRMLEEAYDTFGLDFELNLSTRPEGFLGDPALWDKAEDALTQALNATGREWKLNPGDGAFYGPKIDIHVFDALRRKFQCATVQLDFQLPIRFDLKYTTEAQTEERPVMVHRAILGSVERMFAILTEHYAGSWPLWLSPRQVTIVPISEKSAAYAKEVEAKLRAAKLHCTADLADKKMQKKVAESQVMRWNYILVVGEEEMKRGTVNVRTRDNVVHGERPLEEVIATLQKERDTRSLTCMFEPKEQPAAEAADKPAAAN
ncbi:unnamed protein product [Pedinophyceae sp. YPF-701]|nr:unnamed protein product [Pedinophyceae sp. YPF-701]